MNLNILRNFLLSIKYGIFILVLWSSVTHAITLSESQRTKNLATTALIYEDKSGQLTFKEILSSEIQSEFNAVRLVDDEINFGFSSSTFWIKVPLSRAQNAPENWILEIPYFALDQINFYGNGKSPILTGGERSVASRPLFNRYYAFPVQLATQTQDFYIEVRSRSPMSIPINIWQIEAFSRHVQYDTLLQAFYYGGVGVLGIFNFLLFLYLRDKIYFYYSLFALFLALGIFSGNGYGRLYFWPNNPYWDQLSQSIFLGFAAAIACLFTAEFLNTKKIFPVLNIVFLSNSTLLLASSIGLGSSYFFQFSPSFFLQAIPILSLPGAFLTIYAAINAWRLGQSSAKYFLFAWGVLSVGAVISVLRMFGVVPSNGYTSYSLQIASAIEMLLLSFAIANRIQNERQMRERAQSELLLSKQMMVDSLKASEERLERKVAMRTSDINKMLINEKKLREQYIRFGSMISHEFRNPLGIIETQLALLEKGGGEEILKKRVSIIGSATHRLASLFDRWLQGDRLESGINHIQMQPIQINSWLKELVEKCRQYHGNHKVEFIDDCTNYMIDADEKMLQVVVLNLIDNACKYSPASSKVIIKVNSLPGKIGISVVDEGVGIDNLDHKKIFDDYYQINSSSHTRGVGLGLSFVKKIVEIHNGSIELTSKIGAGSTFTVWLAARLEY